MGQYKFEHLFEGTEEEVFNAIKSYNKYPQYLPGVTNAIQYPPKKPGSVCMVRFEISLIKTFYYTLSFFEKPFKEISWDLEDSDIMVKNKGSWELVSKSKDKTLGIYRLDSSFDNFLLDAMGDKVSNSTFPDIVEGFQKLINDLRQKKSSNPKNQK